MFTTIHRTKNNPLVIIKTFLVTIMLVTSTVHAHEGEIKAKVALIVAQDSNVEKMRMMDIRRLFLGLKSIDSTTVKNPVLNIQSSSLYDEFMKNIMHMTEGSYKRKLIKRIFREGKKEIKEITSLSELNDHLLENIGDISFVEITAVEDMEDIKVIQILW